MDRKGFLFCCCKKLFNTSFTLQWVYNLLCATELFLNKISYVGWFQYLLKKCKWSDLISIDEVQLLWTCPTGYFWFVPAFLKCSMNRKEFIKQCDIREYYFIYHAWKCKEINCKEVEKKIVQINYSILWVLAFANIYDYWAI